MKKAIATLALLAITGTSHAQTYVRPHMDKNGNYREGHVRSNPDQYRFNNYGAENNQFGGTNPYTGERGRQRDEYSSPPQYNKSYGQPQGGNRQNSRGF